MIASEILTRAKGLIDRPEKWVQGTFFVGKRRCTTAALYDGAGMNFETGLLYAQPPLSSEFLQARDTLAGVMKYIRPEIYSGTDPDPITSMCIFNNASTHEELMKCFDQAIQVAAEQEWQTASPAPVLEPVPVYV